MLSIIFLTYLLRIPHICVFYIKTINQYSQKYNLHDLQTEICSSAYNHCLFPRMQPSPHHCYLRYLHLFFFHARYRRTRYYYGSVNQKAGNSKFPLLMTREHPGRRVIVIFRQAVSSPTRERI